MFSSTGYTIVWDLRGKREVVALAYGGGAGTGTSGGMLAAQGAGGAMALGAKRGVSSVCWHPDNVSLAYYPLKSNIDNLHSSQLV